MGLPGGKVTERAAPLRLQGGGETQPKRTVPTCRGGAGRVNGSPRDARPLQPESCLSPSHSMAQTSRFPEPRWGWGGEHPHHLHLGAQGPLNRTPREGRARRGADRLLQAGWSARQTPGSRQHAALTRGTQLGPSSMCVFRSWFPSHARPRASHHGFPEGSWCQPCGATRRCSG